MADELNINALGAELISSWAKEAATAIIKNLKNKYHDINQKEQIDYGIVFETYLQNTENHISMTKTILYGQTPHHLYTFFECIGIASRELVVDTNDINNILEQGKKIIITGTGGIGKSMLMRHLFLNTVKKTSFIPVMIELRSLNQYLPEEISLEDFIFKALDTFGCKFEKKYYHYSLETGCYVFLLDGYDEVKNAISHKVAEEISSFSNKYPDNHIILSSRPLDEFIGWSDFKEYGALSLTKEQALSLISRLEYDEELKAKFYKSLENELFEKYKSFASNPLLLTMMLMTFEERVSMPDNKTDFYEQAFATLFHRHDAMKKGRYQREKSSGLGFEDFKKVFSYFCFKTFFKSQYEFTESNALEIIAKAKNKILPYGSFSELSYLDDLNKAVCMLVHEGLNYRFSHRSFQEFFAAVYTTQLSDEEQKQFISSWLKSISGRMSSDFLSLLLDLQPERFMKNILYDALYELFNMYEAHGRSDEWLLIFLYDGIEISTFGNGDVKIILLVKESYYQTILFCMLHYLHYSYNDKVCNSEFEDVISAIKKKYPSKAGRGRYISFEKLKQDGMFEKVKVSVKWAITRVHYAFDAINKIDVNTFGKEKRFEAMLDEL